MPATAWFEGLFGFTEDDYDSTRRRFCMDGKTLVCKGAPHPRQLVGSFETPTVAELQERCEAASSGGGKSGGLVFRNLALPISVEKLIIDPANAGAVFQVASQFNCLEMINQRMTPLHGVSIYANDATQGPACAIACPAATVYRNYIHGGGQGEQQIDCLAGVGAVVGNGPTDGSGQYWRMQNGYALPTSPSSMRELGARLDAEAGLAETASASLMVGVHWATQARPPATHCVTQVFTSALPCAYSLATKRADWETFARLVLLAAYDATLMVGTATRIPPNPCPDPAQELSDSLMPPSSMALPLAPRSSCSARFQEPPRGLLVPNGCWSQ
jgi:hypothetical protein